MLPIVVCQLLAASSASALTISINLQRPWALFSPGEPPRLPPFPFPRPEPPRPPTHTVYDLITADDRFAKLTKAIEFVGDPIISVLNNTQNELTFFAIPDSALLPPGHDDDDGGDDDDGHDDGGHKHKGEKKHKGGKKHKKKKKKKLIADVLDFAVADHGARDIALKALLVDNTVDVADALALVDQYHDDGCVMDDPNGGHDDGDDDDDDEKKKRREEAFRHIVHSILKYHVLPHGAYDLATLSHNSTYPTDFHVPKVFGGHGQRISVAQHLPKKKKDKAATFINLYAKVVASDIRADNGYIHILNHPLLPPPGIFQELFIAQDHFSTLSSALQRTGLTDEVDVRYVKADEGEEHGHLEGSTAVTVFAPTNEAFQALPMRLKLYLFSPFGQKVLRRLLEYHIVPGVVAHADGIYNQTAETNPGAREIAAPRPWSLFDSFGAPDSESASHEVMSSLNATLPTRLFNHTVSFASEKFKFTEKKREAWGNTVSVNGQEVRIPDIVALNGAVHVLNHVLCPCHCPDHHHEGMSEEEIVEVDSEAWDDWESWLPAWAEAS